MRVLMITGDKKFGPGNSRYDLQKSVVDELAVVYWGRGSVFPKIPKEKFDVVTAQDPFWRGLFAYRTARRLGAKLNIQVHADLYGQSFIKSILAPFVLRRANSLRVVSGRIKQQVEGFGVCVPVSVLPVYVDVAKFQNVVRQPHEGKIILWIGRFEPEKNPEAAIEVLKEVRALGVDAKLIMLGSGAMEAHLRALAGDLPVEFPGWQDPAGYLSTADMVLSTSWHESWGQSIVEALAAGVPVVAPDVGVAREAGAVVVERKDLAKQVVHALQTGACGELKIKLVSKEEWVKKWRESLI